MIGQQRRRLPAILAVATLVIAMAALALIIADFENPTFPALGFNGTANLVLGVTYPIVGWLIASRRPENWIGWIFLAVGLSQAIAGFTAAYAWHGLVAIPGSLPLADLASWVQVWAWVPGYMLLLVLLLVFPDGRLPSTRWRPVLWMAEVALFLMLVPTAIATLPYRGPVLMTPEGPDPTQGLLPLATTLSGIGSILVLLVALSAIAALVVRYRRARGAERQQVKWFAFAGIVEIPLVIATAWFAIPAPFDMLAAIVIIPLVPVATAIAILRYRLYEIDRLVSRTIAYAAVTGGLIVVYLVVNLGLTTAFSSITSGDSVAVAASTLVVAALFTPLRRRVQRVVDRWFDRARYDAERTTAAFSERLRNEVDLPSLVAELDTTVRGAISPSRVDVWLRSARP